MSAPRGVWGEEMTHEVHGTRGCSSCGSQGRRELKNPMLMDAGGVRVHTRGHGSADPLRVLRIGSPFQPVAVDGDHVHAVIKPSACWAKLAVVFHVGRALRVLAVHTFFFQSYIWCVPCLSPPHPKKKKTNATKEFYASFTFFSSYSLLLSLEQPKEYTSMSKQCNSGINHGIYKIMRSSDATVHSLATEARRTTLPMSPIFFCSNPQHNGSCLVRIYLP